MSANHATGRRPGLVLLTVCAATILMPFSIGGVSVALPGIGVALLVSLTASRLAGVTPAAHQVADLINQGQRTASVADAAAAAYTGALHSVALILAVVCAVAVPVTAWLLREPAVQPTTEPAEELVPAGV